jgi:hypothetical protein
MPWPRSRRSADGDLSRTEICRARAVPESLSLLTTAYRDLPAGRPRLPSARRRPPLSADDRVELGEDADAFALFG